MKLHLSSSDSFEEKEKRRSQFEDSQENYDEHLNELLPQNLHRGDVMSCNRLMGYSDAMMATCATFLVIPLRNLHHMDPDISLQEHINHQTNHLIMFFMGFLVVLTIWETINISSMIIKRVDDVILLLWTLVMLVTLCLPFSMALQGKYNSEKVPIIITCCLLGACSVLDAIVFSYVMETPRLLHVELQKYSQKTRRHLRNIFLIKPFITFILVAIGGTLAIFNLVASNVFIAMLIVFPLIRKVGLYMRRRMYSRTKFEKCAFYYFYTRGNVAKERVEAMSDAAIAIIACILILDITVEGFPTAEEVKEHGLVNVLIEMSGEFYRFLAAFIIVSALWFSNHTVLGLFRTINVMALYCQKAFLSFACLSPLCANMILRFVTKRDNDSQVAIRYTSLTVLFSSVANLIMLVNGIFFQSNHLERWALFEHSRINIRQHLYTFTKTLNLPFWSLILALSTLAKPHVSEIFLYICFFGHLLTFVFAKIAFMNHYGKASITVIDENFHARYKTEQNEKQTEEKDNVETNKGSKLFEEKSNEKTNADENNIHPIENNGYEVEEKTE